MGKNEDSFFLNYLPISITLVSLERAELPPFLGSAPSRCDWTGIISG